MRNPAKSIQAIYTDFMYRRYIHSGNNSQLKLQYCLSYWKNEKDSLKIQSHPSNDDSNFFNPPSSQREKLGMHPPPILRWDPKFEEFFGKAKTNEQALNSHTYLPSRLKATQQIVTEQSNDSVYISENSNLCASVGLLNDDIPPKKLEEIPNLIRNIDNDPLSKQKFFQSLYPHIDPTVKILLFLKESIIKISPIVNETPHVFKKKLNDIYTRFASISLDEIGLNKRWPSLTLNLAKYEKNVVHASQESLETLKRFKWDSLFSHTELFTRKRCQTLHSCDSQQLKSDSAHPSNILSHSDKNEDIEVTAENSSIKNIQDHCQKQMSPLPKITNLKSDPSNNNENMYMTQNIVISRNSQKKKSMYNNGKEIARKICDQGDIDYSPFAQNKNEGDTCIRSNDSFCRDINQMRENPKFSTYSLSHSLSPIIKSEVDHKSQLIVTESNNNHVVQPEIVHKYNIIGNDNRPLVGSKHSIDQVGRCLVYKDIPLDILVNNLENTMRCQGELHTQLQEIQEIYKELSKKIYTFNSSEELNKRIRNWQYLSAAFSGLTFTFGFFYMDIGEYFGYFNHKYQN